MKPSMFFLLMCTAAVVVAVSVHVATLGGSTPREIGHTIGAAIGLILLPLALWGISRWIQNNRTAPEAIAIIMFVLGSGAYAYGALMR